MPSDARPRKFEVLATHLRNQIRQGVLKPGDRLPTLVELKSRSGVTSPTIIRAQTILEREGLIMRRRGHGTFVASDVEQRLIAGPLSQAIIVLTPCATPSPTPQQNPGWAIHTDLGILEQAQSTSHHAIMMHPQKIQNSDLEWLIKQGPFGVVIDDNFGGDVEHLRIITDSFRDAEVPMVVLGNMPFWETCDRIESDHEQGAYELTKWMIDHGRTRVVSVRLEGHCYDWMSKRIAGYTRAMEEAGLKPMPIIEAPDYPAENTEENFKRRARLYAGTLIEALVGPEPCDALLMPSDGAVCYYAAACRMFGKEPNKDVLLAGYDNYWQEVPERQWEQSTPDVTVDKDNRGIGKELVKLLTERVEGHLPKEPQVRKIRPKLVVIHESAS